MKYMEYICMQMCFFLRSLSEEAGNIKLLFRVIFYSPAMKTTNPRGEIKCKSHSPVKKRLLRRIAI